MKWVKYSEIFSVLGLFHNCITFFPLLQASPPCNENFSNASLFHNFKCTPDKYIKVLFCSLLCNIIFIQCILFNKSQMFTFFHFSCTLMVFRVFSISNAHKCKKFFTLPKITIFHTHCIQRKIPSASLFFSEAEGIFSTFCNYPAQNHNLFEMLVVVLLPYSLPYCFKYLLSDYLPHTP